MVLNHSMACILMFEKGIKMMIDIDGMYLENTYKRFYNILTCKLIKKKRF
jgi:hypothetical protein